MQVRVFDILSLFEGFLCDLTVWRKSFYILAIGGGESQPPSLSYSAISIFYLLLPFWLCNFRHLCNICSCVSFGAVKNVMVSSCLPPLPWFCTYLFRYLASNFSKACSLKTFYLSTNFSINRMYCRNDTPYEQSFNKPFNDPGDQRLVDLLAWLCLNRISLFVHIVVHISQGFPLDFLLLQAFIDQAEDKPSKICILIIIPEQILSFVNYCFFQFHPSRNTDHLPDISIGVNGKTIVALWFWIQVPDAGSHGTRQIQAITWKIQNRYEIFIVIAEDKIVNDPSVRFTFAYVVLVVRTVVIELILFIIFSVADVHILFYDVVDKCTLIIKRYLLFPG